MSAGTYDGRSDVVMSRASSDHSEAGAPSYCGAGGNKPLPSREGVACEPALEALGLIQRA